MSETPQNNNVNVETGGAPPLPYSPQQLNVHADYSWTLSDKEIRGYVPTIELIEYKLVQSGELISLKQSAAAIKESVAAQVAIGAAGAQRGAEAKNIFRSTAPGRRGSLINLGLDLAAPVVGGAAAVGAFRGFVNQFSGLEEDNPYLGLYPAEPTKWSYVLPYLNIDNMVQIDNSWSPVDTAAIGSALGALGGYTGLGSLFKSPDKNKASPLEFLQAARQTELLLSNPGAAIEKIKKFTPADKGDQIGLTFYLFNTERFSDIKKNWEFLYTLTYQNLPNRRSINLLDPPCVYNVTVPGYKNFPVAVIENLKVTNEGTTRLIDIQTGEIVTNRADPNVKLIPEAFKVTLNIRSLLTPTKNLFLYSSNSKDKMLNVYVNTGASRSANEQEQGGPTTGQTYVPKLNPNAQNTPEENEIIRRSRGFGR